MLASVAMNFHCSLSILPLLSQKVGGKDSGDHQVGWAGYSAAGTSPQFAYKLDSRKLILVTTLVEGESPTSDPISMIYLTEDRDSQWLLDR